MSQQDAVTELPLNDVVARAPLWLSVYVLPTADPVLPVAVIVNPCPLLLGEQL